MKLAIGNKNYSTWSLRPWLLMKHFELAFEEIHVPLFAPEMSALMDKHCPSKKVPTLHDDGVIIWRLWHCRLFFCPRCLSLPHL